MAFSALDVFGRLVEQVEEIERVASRTETDASSAAILRRSAYVLAVASVDTYFHEQAARLLFARAKNGGKDSTEVAAYLGSRVTAADLAGASAEAYVRLGLSYKTLVSPDAIDKALTACGLSPESIWLNTAFALGSRPDRLRLQLQLFYDRRNQIAHEGDWDFIQLDFRVVEQAHLADCVRQNRQLIANMDALL